MGKFDECETPFTKCWCEAVPARANNPHCQSLLPSVPIESDLLMFLISIAILFYLGFLHHKRNITEGIEEAEPIQPKELKKGEISEYETVIVEFGGGLFGEPVRDEKTFDELVLKKIQEGFKPYGEVQISIKQTGSFLGHSGRTVMTQSMVKYQE